MLETNRRENVGKAVLDLAKLVFAGQLATGFLAHSPWYLRLGAFAGFVLLFGLGWFALPPKKGD